MQQMIYKQCGCVFLAEVLNPQLHSVCNLMKFKECVIQFAIGMKHFLGYVER